MRLKVRYHDILAETEAAILFLISEEEVWLPKAAVRFCAGNFFSVSEEMAQKKGLRGTALYHVPEKLEPTFNQEALDELRYDAGIRL